MAKIKTLYHVNIGHSWKERIKQLSKKTANASNAELCRWGLEILEQTIASTPWLSYGPRLNGRSIPDILAQLWKLWVNGDIVLQDD